MALKPTEVRALPAVLNRGQYDDLKTLELCFDSLVKISNSDDHPEPIHYFMLFGFLSQSFALLMEEIEIAQPKNTEGDSDHEKAP